MFERLDDSCRRLIVMAQEEARLVPHNFIGTEHLLLGFLASPGEIGRMAISSLGLDANQVRGKVIDLVPPTEHPKGHIPFTPRAKRVLEMAVGSRLNVGSEHILLALAEHGEGVAAEVLESQVEGGLTKVTEVVRSLEPDAPEGESS